MRSDHLNFILFIQAHEWGHTLFSSVLIFRWAFCNSAAGQKIVHYGPNDNRYRRDAAVAKEAGNHLADDIGGDSEAAAHGRHQLAGDLWGHHNP